MLDYLDLLLAPARESAVHSIRGPLGQTGTRHGANAEKKREVVETR